MKSIHHCLTSLKVILHFCSDEHQMSKQKKDKLNKFKRSSETTGLGKYYLFNTGGGGGGGGLLKLKTSVEKRLFLLSCFKNFSFPLERTENLWFPLLQPGPQIKSFQPLVYSGSEAPHTCTCVYLSIDPKLYNNMHHSVPNF